MKSYLKPLSKDNILLKYADDITLLVPNTLLSAFSREFLTLKLGQQPINCLNIKRANEIVLRQPRARSHYIPLPLVDVDRVASAKLLGSYFSGEFQDGYAR